MGRKKRLKGKERAGAPRGKEMMYRLYSQVYWGLVTIMYSMNRYGISISEFKRMVEEELKHGLFAERE